MEREFELEPGETSLKEVRKYWLFLAFGLIPYIILAFVPFIIPPALKFAPQLLSYVRQVNWASPFFQIMLGVWWLLLWTIAFGAFTKYFLNAWIITDRRIVDIKQRAFFNREVSSLMLDRVQDVTIDTDGLVHSLLDIGDINVQTAGAVDRFTMDNVPNPPELRDLILEHVAAHAAPADGVS